MKTVYLSLGSNLGDREGNLRRALESLGGKDLRVVRVSSLYETDPRDLPDQPVFLNLVAEVTTSLFPLQLLRRTQKQESEQGRQRMVPKGPRTIDIDILTYERFRIETPQLTVPHARMSQRRFVLEPLAELAPDWIHPVTGRAMRELLAEVRDQGVRKRGAFHWEGQ